MAATPAASATIVVNDLTDTSSTSSCTLRDAITAANTDSPQGGCAAGDGADTIVFSVAGTITLNGTQLPTITSAITIDGESEDRVTLDANQLSRHLFISGSATVTVRWLTFTNGLRNVGGTLVDRSGGAISNSGTLVGSSLVLEHVTFTNNRATGQGGAVYARGPVTIRNSRFMGNRSSGGGGVLASFATLEVFDSVFAGNVGSGAGGGADVAGGTALFSGTAFTGNEASSSGGGGIFVRSGARATVEDGIFAGNQAETGGGAISNAGGEVTIRRSALTGNSASGDGGAINSAGIGTRLTVSRSAFIENQATRGGAITSNSANTFSNTTFSANAATSEGGALLINGSPGATIVNSTFFENTAPTGGAIHKSLTNTVTLRNSLVKHGGTQNSCSGELAGGTNLTDDSGCTGVFLPPVDLRLGGLQDDHHEPQPGSPAIDTGDDIVCASAPVDGVDQRGFERPADGNLDGAAICDIGAIEVQVPAPAPELTAAPETAINLVGTAHTVTATLTQGGEPVGGVPLSFAITSGPHAGETATDTTAANGVAVFTYTGTAAGTDTIEVSCSASDCPPAGVTVTVGKTWEEPTGRGPALPRVSVLMTARPSSVPAGGEVVYRYRLFNIGLRPVTLMSLMDDKLGDLNGQGTCETGGSIPPLTFYTCVVSAVPYFGHSTSHTSVVTAIVEDSLGRQATGSDSVTVRVRP